MESWSQNNIFYAGVQDAENSDYISILPDPLLCCILSYIPTKSAVATSILSKRWKTVWTKVPTLDFTEMPYLGSCCTLGPQETLFQNFVDKVLSCNDGLNMEILRLQLFSGISSEHASDWLSDIMKRKFREIELTCYCPKMELPATFFEREKLVVLKLTCFSLDVPDSLYCPNLEILHLIHSSLNDKSLWNLTSGSPVLDELVIDSCRGISRLNIYAPTLRTLEIKDTLTGHGEHALLIDAQDIEILYLSDLASNYNFTSFTPEKAVVTVHHEGVSNHSKKLVKLLHGIYRLKNLKLGRATMEILQVMVQRRQLRLPVFVNLLCLEVTVGMWSVILQMLAYTPILVSLIIHNFSPCSQSEWQPLSKVPKCLRSTLQEITIDQLNQDEGEMKLVEYLLKNAMVLKKLEFSRVLYDPCPGGSTDVIEKLRELSIRSGSREVEVVLCEPQT